MSTYTLYYYVRITGVNAYTHTIDKACILNPLSFLHVFLFVEMLSFLEGHQLYWIKAYPNDLIF